MELAWMSDCCASQKGLKNYHCTVAAPRFVQVGEMSDVSEAVADAGIAEEVAKMVTGEAQAALVNLEEEGAHLASIPPF